MNNNDNNEKINIAEEGIPTINIVNEDPQTEPVINISSNIPTSPVTNPQTVPQTTPIIPNNVVSAANNPVAEQPTIPAVNNTQQVAYTSNNNTASVNDTSNITVKESTSSDTTNNVPGTPKIEEDEEEKETLGDKLKRILLVIFLVFAGLFVFFLPNISEYFNGVRSNTYKENVVENGYLKCTKTNSNDSSSTEYEYLLNFKNKGITDGTYTTTYENEDEKKVTANNAKCNEIEKISENIDGIDVSCSVSNNISTTTQNNIYRNIKTGKLTAFTEAGGIYPEYKYNDDIYGIEAKLVKAGYDCDISAGTD